MDGRRRQWIKWDVFFNDGPLGAAMRERFGVCGMTVFQSFLSACKKSSVQGRISYGNDVDALATMGLPDLDLVNEKGEEWTLDEFWTFLGQRKQIRRQRRGRITDVISTRWEQWQNTPPTQPERPKNRRSQRRNAERKESGAGLESERESERETSSLSVSEEPAPAANLDDDEGSFLDEAWRRYWALPDDRRAAVSAVEAYVAGIANQLRTGGWSPPRRPVLRAVPEYVPEQVERATETVAAAAVATGREALRGARRGRAS